MLMLKKGMMLVGLIFFSLPANAGCTLEETARKVIMGFQQEGNDSNLLIVFYVQIMPDDFVMQLHRF